MKLIAQSITALSIAISAVANYAATRTSPLIVDHSYDISAVPTATWEALRTASPIIHYAHRSDGSAVTWGLDSLAKLDASKWPYIEEYTGMPDAGSGLRVWNGMTGDDYITPDKYWTTEAARNNLTQILTDNPTIKYTSWTWCNEDDYWAIGPSQSDNNTLTDYFRIMDSLEQEFPNVTFIYQTAAIRDPGSDDAKLSQAAFNDSLRHWAIKNNKILFDFADLDAWYNGDYHTIVVNNKTIPYQNPAWLEESPATNGHHANDAMGLDKGKAWWYLMARLETGWTPSTNPSFILKMKTQPQWSKARVFDLLGRRNQELR